MHFVAVFVFYMQLLPLQMVWWKEAHYVEEQKCVCVCVWNSWFERTLTGIRSALTFKVIYGWSTVSHWRGFGQIRLCWLQRGLSNGINSGLQVKLCMEICSHKTWGETDLHGSPEERPNIAYTRKKLHSNQSFMLLTPFLPCKRGSWYLPPLWTH